MSINVNSAQASAGLLLVPMFIPGWRSPVQPAGLAHGGIPKSIYQAPNGLALVIDPVTMLKSFVLAAFDTVEVWVNGKATSVSKVILPGEEQERILMYLPLGLLVNGVNQLFYRVTRPSENFEDSTPVLDVLYHNLAPGEPAPAGITIVFPPNIVANGVGPAEAAAGVPVTFIISYARPFDEIRLDVGTWSTTITVTDPSKPITLTLTAADFQQIGDNAQTPVKCTVTDQLSNGNQSATTYLNIHVNQLDLLAPTVKGQTDNNFNPTLQDVRVVVPKGSLLPTDKVIVIWQGATGTPAAGSYTSPPRLVSAGLEFVVPRSVLAYSLGKTVTVTYSIERNDITSTSLPLSLNILTLPVTALIPPKIVEADANNVLDLMALGTKDATIHGLLWTLIEAGQQVWMGLEGKKADGTAHNLQVWSGGSSRVNTTWVSQGFWPKPVLNSFLAALGHGTTLTIKFMASLDKSNNAATATVFPDRTYTIRSVELVIPTLVNVLDANNVEVPEGTSTISTTLKLKGKASNGQQVEIFDGSGASAVSKGKATAHATTGDWDLTITLDPGAHRLYAKSLYHSAPVYSNVRTLTVTLPLSVDTSMLRLDGVMVRSRYCPNLNGVDAIGNTALRQASGGKPSYHYQSSNQQVATVDANGKVTGMGNGTAIITITDQSNAQVSYSVAVSNVYSLVVHGGHGWTYARYIQSLAQRGEVDLTSQIRAVMARCFFQPWVKWWSGPTQQYPNAWTGVTSGASAEVYNTDTRSFGWLAQTADPTSGLSFSLKNAGAMGGLEAVEDLEVREIVDMPPVDDQ
ncbi:Ig-like domain-containing protein [Pseudomonas frederiksbergensis]|uniref:Ig-like domain-containing protein n=1 Tax=Pseudomonas frederiksbergensis TaxID=104087 RepID=UPI003D1CFBA8